jgi:signal transduction histidine kinase
MASHADMETALRTLCDSVAECGVRVLLRVPIAGSIPRRVGDQIYRLVQEGLSNAIRHAQATTLRVDLFLLPHRIQLVVADDGRGFPFQGTYNLQTLNARGLGPVSIKERVATLKGELTLVSSADGSRLTIALPRMRAPMTSSLHTSIS